MTSPIHLPFLLFLHHNRKINTSPSFSLPPLLLPLIFFCRSNKETINSHACLLSYTFMHLPYIHALVIVIRISSPYTYASHCVALHHHATPHIASPLSSPYTSSSLCVTLHHHATLHITLPSSSSYTSSSLCVVLHHHATLHIALPLSSPHTSSSYDMALHHHH